NQDELPKPPGMVFLEGGPVTLGTPPETLATLLAGRPALIRALFAHEAPRHDTRVPAYWMGRFEVTNAQYLKFLQDHTREHTTRPGGLDSLETLAATLLGRPTVDAGRGARGSTQAWRQLYEGNRGAIWKAFSGAGRDVLVLRPDGSVDLDATALRCRREPLPAGLKLAFYAYAPPKHWPGLRPAAAQENHPVGYVSYNDAERMAEWAGMHVPTEAEWEWAARGPDGRRYPWGDAWALDDSRANWGGKITNDRYEPTTLPV
ncbi:MAG: SUMF1/EgtB/PvdO family nonheme iron enzyme, partial [Planctomycetota bacterium]|nr:SUMF1/EgtB/PvdO family nonheme iron enzyme [Planctomycetota bacterium]